MHKDEEVQLYKSTCEVNTDQNMNLNEAEDRIEFESNYRVFYLRRGLRVIVKQTAPTASPVAAFALLFVVVVSLLLLLEAGLAIGTVVDVIGRPRPIRAMVAVAAAAAPAGRPSFLGRAAVAPVPLQHVHRQALLERTSAGLGHQMRRLGVDVGLERRRRLLGQPACVFRAPRQVLRLPRHHFVERASGRERHGCTGGGSCGVGRLVHLLLRWRRRGLTF